MITESPSGTERIISAATVEEEKGSLVYTFARDGARFRVAAGERPHIVREGDISYRLSFDPREETAATIVSAFGEIPVRVRTQRVECVREGEAVSLDCDYVLDFSGDIQQHRLRFSARPHTVGKEGRRHDH